MYPIMVNVTVAGVPAKAKVRRYERHKGSMSRFAQDPDEYFGWAELDYELRDRKGYKAKWLEQVADKHDAWEELEAKIIEEVTDILEGLREDQMERRKESMA